MPLERVLDWRSNHDPRSRNYPIRTLLAGRKPRSYTWPVGVTLDQGREGACVGFAWAHELNATPVRVAATAEQARSIYARAQTIDEWPGEQYEGTSVLAGAKVVRDVGFMDEYRWAFGVQDVIDTVGAYGPVVLGVPWFEGMYEPDDAGYLYATGRVLGGHAILCRGVSLTRGHVVLHNSWGADWGVNGTALLSFDDLALLLERDGEACVPVVRRAA